LRNREPVRVEPSPAELAADDGEDRLARGRQCVVECARIAVGDFAVEVEEGVAVQVGAAVGDGVTPAPIK